MRLEELIGDHIMDIAFMVFVLSTIQAVFVTDTLLLSVGGMVVTTYLGGLFESNPLCKKVLGFIETVLIKLSWRR